MGVGVAVARTDTVAANVAGPTVALASAWQRKVRRFEPIGAACGRGSIMEVVSKVILGAAGPRLGRWVDPTSRLQDDRIDATVQ